MTNAREAAVDWAARALAHELSAFSGQLSAVDVEERAETLVAIAEHYGVPDDVLIAWIHAMALGKEWSAAEFRAWCEAMKEETNAEAHRS